MTEEFDDCEFWLPPEFMTEDDFMMLGFSSPGESVVSLTDSENEEYNFGFRSTTSQLSCQQLQAARFEQLRRELKKTKQGGGVWVQENGGCGELYQIKANQQLAQIRMQNCGRRQVGLSSSGWPTLQQPGSGMRAIFLGNPGASKERTGTGVFLPRRTGSTESPKIKPDAAMKYGRKNEYNTGKERQNIENSTRSQSIADEVQLPPEWIY